MIVLLKALVLAFAVAGISGTGAATELAHAPMQKAIEIHESHLAQNTTMPEQCLKGQQTAIDHLMKNKERWLAGNHAWEHDDDLEDMDEPRVL
jgi:hypothetical protein